MYMTALRPSTPQDWAKADTIAQELREAIEKYKDYHVALSKASAFSCRIFRKRNITSPVMKTPSWNRSRSIPRAPLLCYNKKTKTGYDLIGAMYTMPKRVTEEQIERARSPQRRAVAPARQTLLDPLKETAADMPS